MKSPNAPWVLGLDLSLSATGWCLLPPSWAPGDWTMQFGHVGSDLKKDASAELRVRRIAKIVDGLRVQCLGLPTNQGRVKVFVEDYAYGLAGAGGMRLAELGGAVKNMFWDEFTIVVEPLNASTARKFLIGRGSGKGIKDEVFRQLKQAGALFKTQDEGDAFVIGNLGRSELGLPALTLVQQEEVTEKRARQGTDVKWPNTKHEKVGSI